MSETVKISDIAPDPRNANKGTERGRFMLERSLEKLGAGRSILLDKNGRIIAGNKTTEVANAIGIDEIEIVRTNGDKLVAVMREDLDLDDPTGQARELAYADNRVGQVDLDFDPETIALDIDLGVDLGDWWMDWELPGEAEPVDYDEMWQGMPEFEQGDKTSFKRLVVHFATEEDMNDFAELIGQSINAKTSYLWYPAQVRANLKVLTYTDES